MKLPLVLLGVVLAVLAVSARRIAFSRNIEPELNAFQIQATDLGLEIESELQDFRFNLITALDAELNRAQDGYVTQIGRVYQRHLQTFSDLILISIPCYTDNVDELTARYREAGVAVNACLELFNSQSEDLVNIATDDNLSRSKPVELPSFILSSTADENIFSRPDVTLNAVSRSKEQITNEWNSEKLTLGQQITALTNALGPLNANLNACFASQYANFVAQMDALHESAIISCASKNN